MLKLPQLGVHFEHLVEVGVVPLALVEGQVPDLGELLVGLIDQGPIHLAHRYVGIAAAAAAAVAMTVLLVLMLVLVLVLRHRDQQPASRTVRDHRADREDPVRGIRRGDSDALGRIGRRKRRRRRRPERSAGAEKASAAIVDGGDATRSRKSRQIGRAHV